MGYNLIKWEEGEKGKFVVFLSHSSADKGWRKFRDDLAELGVRCECDSDIDAGASDFAETIRKMILQREVFLLYLTGESTLTQWVLYELGIAAGQGKKIILCSDEAIDAHGNYFFEKFGPIIYDRQKLLEEIKSGFFFADLFTHESKQLSKAAYVEEYLGNIEICDLSIDIPHIQELPKSVFRFGYILLGVGLYWDGNLTMPQKRCRKTAKVLSDDCRCVSKDCVCPFYAPTDRVTDVTLNKLLYNCHLSESTLKVKLPFHRMAGVTFKMFMDLTDGDYAKDAMRILNEAGMYDVSLSHSANGNRVYFMLKKQPMNGIFEAIAPDGCINNYLCAGTIL